MFVSVPKTKGGKAATDTLKGVRKAVEQANRNAQAGVESGAEQAVASSSLLINTVAVRCGNDMCLSKDLTPNFRCDDQPPSACTGFCAPPKPTWIDFRGTLVASKKGNAEKGDVNSLVVKGKTITKTEYEAETFDWKAYMDSTDCEDQCTFRATDGTKTSEAECTGGCVWASVTRGGITEKKCITDFTKTAKRACFGGCVAKGAVPPKCTTFAQKQDGACPPNTNGVTSAEMDECIAYAKRTQTTAAMAKQLVASYDGKTYSAPTMTDADARAFCEKACFSSAGEQSVVVPVYETDAQTVKPCPTVNGAQTFPFPSGEEASDPVCEKAGDGLVATKNMILAGKGDDGICRIENVDQENQGKVVRKALDQTLQETDLRTIRKEIAKVAQRVAQSGFPFAQYGNVQNLSKRLIQAARTIRSKAAQDCGGDQSMRNLAMKVCRNVAINGKAMPCVLNKASQINVAAQAGECLQQVMVKTKAMQEAVSTVETSSSLTLENRVVVSTAKAINIGILAVLLTVGVVVAIAAVRRPKKGLLSVGAGLAAIGAGYLGLSIVLASQKVRPSKDYRTYAGIKGPPVDGKKTELSGTIADVKDACDQDVGCRGWVFESKSKPEVCGAASCSPDTCLDGGDCDACCPSGCVSMVDRVRPAATPESSACKGKGEGACKKPCLWTGERCIDAPSAWGAPTKPTEERLWCMACSDKKGTGTLYHTMPNTMETVDDVPPSQLACLTSIPFTGAIKTAPTPPVGKADAPRLRTVGIVGLSAGILCICVGAWLARA